MNDGRVLWERLTKGEPLVALCSAMGLSRERVIEAFNGEVEFLRGEIDQLIPIQVGSIPDAPEEPDIELPRDFRLEVSELEELMYEIDLLRAIRAGLLDAAAGRVIDHEDAMAELRTALGF